MSFYNSYFKPKFKAFSFDQTTNSGINLNQKNRSSKEVQKSHYEIKLENSRQNLIKIRKEFSSSFKKTFDTAGKLLTDVGGYVVERSKYEVTHGWTSSLLKAGWTVVGGVAKAVTTPISLAGSLSGSIGEKFGDFGDALIDVNKGINSASTHSIRVGLNKVGDALSDRLPKAERIQRIELKNSEIRSVLQNAIINRQNNRSLLDEMYRLYPVANPNHPNFNSNFDYYSALLEVVDEDGDRTQVEESALRNVLKLTKEKNPNWVEKGLKTTGALLETSARTVVGGVGYGVGTTIGLAGSAAAITGKTTQFLGNSFGSVFQNNLSEAITDGLSNRNGVPKDTTSASRANQSASQSANQTVSIPNQQSKSTYQAQPSNPFANPNLNGNSANYQRQQVAQPQNVDKQLSDKERDDNDLKAWINKLATPDKINVNLAFTHFSNKYKVNVRGEGSKYVVNIYNIDQVGNATTPIESGLEYTSKQDIITKLIGK